jgi:hypothetical protein
MNERVFSHPLSSQLLARPRSLNSRRRDRDVVMETAAATCTKSNMFVLPSDRSSAGLQETVRLEFLKQRPPPIGRSSGIKK